MKTILLPLDNRPVTFSFPRMIGQVAGLNVLMPPRSLLGSLERPAQPTPLAEWLDSTIAESNPAVLLLCLDSVFYGGLINSRRCLDTPPQVLERVARLDKWKSAAGASTPILAQSSIMRIADNYDASEEKTYWARYGREIFAWSALLHRLSRGDKLAQGLLAGAELKIPPEVREDYLSTRRRNFQVNRALVDKAESGVIDVLAFSLDDSGEFGLNMLEKERLLADISARELSGRVLCYPGADEVLCSLLSRWLVMTIGKQPRVAVEFSPPETARCPSRYEGQTVGQTVRAQLLACGMEQEGKSADADFIVIVHGNERQGDHIRLPEQPDLRQADTTRSVKHTLEVLDGAAAPCVICDVAYANGSDPLLVEKLLDRKDLVGKLWGYAGWNTTGNSTGSALAQAAARWFARQTGVADKVADESLRRCLFVRLADDWAYQSRIRGSLESALDANSLAGVMEPHVKRIAGALDCYPSQLRVKHPWNRTFEIEVDPDSHWL